MTRARTATAALGEADAPVPRGLVVAAGLGVFLLVLGLRHYGLELVDEGTLLAQTERVRTGQWPYRDFHTGYGPASFALNAGLLTLFGVRLEVVRVGLAVTHAVGLAALAVLAARALGGSAAAVVLALTVSFFLPIAPGAFCLWNVPYPAWYAQALAALALLAALATPRRGRAALLASGACCGLAFCFKQNTGVLTLAGVLVWRAFERTDPQGGQGSAALGMGLGLAMAGGALAILAGGSLGVTGEIALVLPVLALAVRVGRLRPSWKLVADGAWLGAGAALVVVPVLLVTVRAVGWPALARQILHVGSGAATIYGAAYPGTSDLATAMAGMSSGWRGLRRAMDLAWLFVFPLAQLIAAVGLRPVARGATWRLLVPTAILSYLQLYPRADFWHLLPCAGVSVVVAVGVALGSRAPGGGKRVLLGALLMLAMGRWLPNLAVVRAALSPPPPTLPVLARAHLRWDLAAAPALRTVPDVVGALTGAREVIGFPALAVFNFLSGVPSPLRHDYFFPGLLSDSEEQAIVAALARAPTARVVVLRDRLAFFPESFASHAPIAAAIERDFPAVRSVGPYEVRAAAP